MDFTATQFNAAGFSCNECIELRRKFSIGCACHHEILNAEIADLCVSDFSVFVFLLDVHTVVTKLIALVGRLIR
jgi:hypothetical protein